ncbi:MAG: 50S ribosomal protein L9 [Candidatus Melainabacteria bacterium]|nr:50S ribosomal protein L9 [Candidatus Melainabacteria bacterium]
MSNIKLLLKEKVDKLGDIGEIVSVKPGYARNFLLPNGLAAIPTLGEIKAMQRKKELLEKQYKEEKLTAEELAKKISEYPSLSIVASSGAAGKLFGRITPKDIAEKLTSLIGENIDRKQVLLKRSISELGEYEIKLKLHGEVITQIKLIVKKEDV